ncbi:MAG: CDP-alcohol phosphatidyltransferase family protein [Anaerolineae bacterium]|jgi:CDP-diacylglycerol--glycerol-3-phosphate 3-phosphatidyltransferase|nr:CDP-alcohol phosphatidyltransferase family protein [Anaerolineae bacterium]
MTVPPPITLTDRLRRLVAAPLNSVAGWLHRRGIHPDMITTAGLVIVLVASLFIARGELQTGALILIAGLPLDALDGAVARIMQRQGHFGAVLDSTLDRYADGFIFAALSYHFAVQGRLEMLVLAQLAAIGSFGVSYVRARADEVDVSVRVNVGLFTRLERLAVIVAMLLMPGLLLIPALLDIGMLILAVGTNITTLQRLWYVYRTLKRRGE